MGLNHGLLGVQPLLLPHSCCKEGRCALAASPPVTTTSRLGLFGHQHIQSCLLWPNSPQGGPWPPRSFPLALGDSGAASQHPAGSEGITNTLCSCLVRGESEISDTTGATSRRLWPWNCVWGITSAFPSKCFARKPDRSTGAILHHFFMIPAARLKTGVSPGLQGGCFGCTV